MDDNAVFCDKCGFKNIADDENGGAVTAEAAAMAADNTVPVKAKKKTGRKHTLLSVLIVVIAVVIGIYVSTAYSLRTAVNEENIAKLTKEIDFSKIRVDFLSEDGKSLTLAKLISNNTGKSYRQFLTEDNIDELLKQKFVRKFTEKKLNDYIDDLFYDTGDGEFTQKEFEELLNKNMDDIYKVTGLYMDEEMVSELASDMGDEFYESTSLSEIRDEAPTAFNIVKSLLSYKLMIFLCVVAVVLVVCIVLVQDRKTRAIGYAGAGLTAVGIVDIVCSLMSGVVTDSLNKALALGNKFWQLLLSPMQSSYMKLGCIMTAAGIVLIIVNIVIRRKINVQK